MASTSIEELFLDHSTRKLDQMTAAIDLCLARLTPEQIWRRTGANENAIGNLVLHLCGNINQFIGHYLAGEPDIRDRPAEFATAHVDPASLSSALHSTVARGTGTLRTLPHARLAERVVTRDGERSVLEVIYQVVGHFQQHTGQLIFATKQLTGEDLAIYKP